MTRQPLNLSRDRILRGVGCVPLGKLGRRCRNRKPCRARPCGYDRQHSTGVCAWCGH